MVVAGPLAVAELELTVPVSAMVLVLALAWSVVTVSWASVRVAWAWVTAACRAVGSRAARVCPAVTCWPTVTSTEATSPPTGNVAVAWLLCAAVPVRSRTWVTSPRLTAAVT